MSLWPKELKFGFGAERLLCLGVERRIRARVTEKQAINIKSPSTGRPWEATLQALDAYLKSRKDRRVRSSVVLSNRFVRYVVLPWHDAVVSRTERLAQARHCFRQIYGESADGWSIECSASRYGRPSLATAIDRALRDGLREVFSKNACRIQTMQPYLTAAYGQFHRKLSAVGKPPHFFSVVEPSYISCLELAGGSPRAVYNQRVQSDWRSELQGILLQASGNNVQTGKILVSVLAPDNVTSVSESRADGYKRLAARSLSGFSPVTDGGFAMALMAAA